MDNTPENIELIEIKKKRLSEINATISELNREKAFVSQEILKLDDVKRAAFAKARSKRIFAEMVKKQDMVVTALKFIGKPTTAGPICKELKKVGLDIHNSFFAATFLDAVKKDKRVVVTVINASKNEYSLKEWK